MAYDEVNNKDRIGHLGQLYVMTELLKNNIECLDISMRKMSGVCDIITEKSICIEIKTSVYKNGWGFSAIQRSNADFIVFVCLKQMDLDQFITYKKEEIKTHSFKIKNIWDERYRGHWGLNPIWEEYTKR